jgi:hypothetical protein
VAPLLVVPNGQFELTISLANVINAVYDRYKHNAEVTR